MASTGTIIVQVHTSRAQVPIPGATVAITQKGAGGRHKLLAVRDTDQNGRTEPIVIPTPDIDASFFPGGQVPFSLCDVWGQASGFEVQLIEDVQIFPGTETIQNLELIPLPEQTPPRSRAEVVQIPPQDL